MSGHSKWSQIKRQKQAGDLKRGRIFSKLGNQISIAAKGDADPASNVQLRLIIDQARSFNMPKENIDRAIKRGSGQLPGVEISSFQYDIFGPGGTTFIIEGATDNKNRSLSEIKNILSRHGGKMGQTGSVSYLFKNVGLIITEAGQNKEETELKVMDSGAEDYEEANNEFLIYTDPRGLEIVKKNLEGEGIKIKGAKLSWEPRTTIRITDLETAKKILKFSEELEDYEDVTAVYSNFDIAEEVLKDIDEGK